MGRKESNQTNQYVTFETCMYSDEVGLHAYIQTLAI